MLPFYKFVTLMWYNFVCNQAIKSKFAVELVNTIVHSRNDDTQKIKKFKAGNPDFENYRGAELQLTVECS